MGAEVEPPGDPFVGGQTPVTHQVSHLGLLRRCGLEKADRLDAIVVPASRPAHNLATAMKLALSVDAHLVVMCSGGTPADEVGRMVLTYPGLRATVIDLSDGYKHPELDEFETAGVLGAAPAHLGDLYLKRNIGLLLGAAAGWHSLLFLDDDIRDIPADLVQRAVKGLDRFDAVGMCTGHFPDNSVVCHANRLAGGRQDIFVSGSALVVDPSRDAGFFPQVYNEDWLFLIESARRGALGRAGWVTQLDFDPFADPQRAAAEEFGDVLAEGLMALVRAGRLQEAGTVVFWEHFLAERERFITDTIGRLCANPEVGADAAEAAVRALMTAQTIRSEIRPEVLVDYVKRWESDRVRWRRLRERIAAQASLAAGLRSLDLTDRVVGRGAMPPARAVARKAGPDGRSPRRRLTPWSWTRARLGELAGLLALEAPSVPEPGDHRRTSAGTAGGDRPREPLGLRSAETVVDGPAGDVSDHPDLAPGRITGKRLLQPRPLEPETFIDSDGRRVVLRDPQGKEPGRVARRPGRDRRDQAAGDAMASPGGRDPEAHEVALVGRIGGQVRATDQTDVRSARFGDEPGRGVHPGQPVGLGEGAFAGDGGVERGGIMV
ncbi:hypothetical protein BCD48_00390 [Pseudofrankia sp. BMG5.36]|nr:hypothetical protein BCD48_00390 [Pseudofrankia sp. BMG5.36]